MSILIIDDSEDDRLLLENYLTRVDFKDIILKESAEAAFDYLGLDNGNEETPEVDLILMDLVMPGMDGITACRRIKDSPRLQDVPIIMVSALDEVANRMEALDSGAMDYIYKPVNKLELLARVRSALKLKDAVDQYKSHARALQKSEEFLAKSQQIAHLGSWEFDIIHTKMSWSDETFRILGYRPKEIIPTQDAFVQAVHPEDQYKFRNLFTTTLNFSYFENMEYRIVHSDGSERIVYQQSEFNSNDVGRPTKIISTIQDITERRWVDEALVKARRQEVEIAFKIQKTLLQGIPPMDVSDVRVAAFSVPSSYIDGDFYDFFRHNDTCFDLVIGDLIG